MESYDVVVIGAGNGGMTSAAVLAQKGLKVLLLERHNIPGGCGTSFCRGRFEFEVALHLLSCLGPPDNPGPLRDVFNTIGIVDDLAFVDMTDIARIIMPGSLDLVLKTDKAQFVDALESRFPHEKEAIRRFFDFVDRISLEFVSAFLLNDPDVTREKYPLLFQYGFRSVKQLLEEYFSDPLLKAVVSVTWGYTGLPPDSISMSSLVLTFWIFFQYGLHHVKGGSQAVSNAIVNRFLAHGGTVRFNCGAKKIVVEAGAVKAVVTDDGEHIPTKYVVSNASTVTTYRDLVGPDHVPAGVFADMRRSTVGTSAFAVYVGLDCEPDEVGIAESTNFLMSGTDIGQGCMNSMRELDIGSDLIMFSCFDIADPEFSPKGTCQLNMVCLKYADPWLHVPPPEYAKAKYRCAEAMLNRLEEGLPGVRSHIEEVAVATPLTFMRYLGHPQGAIYGFDRYRKDIPFTKAASFNVVSEVKGLYFAGGWMGDHGFPATYMSGPAAAEAILSDLEG